MAEALLMEFKAKEDIIIKDYTYIVVDLKISKRKHMVLKHGDVVYIATHRMGKEQMDLIVVALYHGYY